MPTSSPRFTKKRFIQISLSLSLILIASVTAIKTVPSIQHTAYFYSDSIAVQNMLIRRIAYRLGLYSVREIDNQLGDGGLATNAAFNDPTGVYVDKLGRVYISERRHFRIRMVHNGKISTIAGNGVRGYSGDNRPATQVRLSRPEGLDGDEKGNLYFADSFNHRIRRITPAGIIETVAGNGLRGYAGDGGLAINAQLAAPMDVKIGPSGNIYILERDNHAVRRINNQGIIETIVGNGWPGEGGDGGPAKLAQLNEPYGIGVDNQENIYIADSANNRVRKISAVDGTISTIAGTGVAGFSGDGGKAVSAKFNSPQAISITPDQQLLVNDEHNNRIRKITTDGHVNTVIGTGSAGFSGDGGQALLAQLNDPEYMWTDSTGTIYVSDGDNQRVRKISTDGIISTFAGNGRKQTLSDK